MTHSPQAGRWGVGGGGGGEGGFFSLALNTCDSSGPHLQVTLRLKARSLRVKEADDEEEEEEGSKGGTLRHT